MRPSCAPTHQVPLRPRRQRRHSRNSPCCNNRPAHRHSHRHRHSHSHFPLRQPRASRYLNPHRSARRPFVIALRHSMRWPRLDTVWRGHTPRLEWCAIRRPCLHRRGRRRGRLRSNRARWCASMAGVRRRLQARHHSVVAPAAHYGQMPSPRPRHPVVADAVCVPPAAVRCARSPPPPPPPPPLPCPCKRKPNTWTASWTKPRPRPRRPRCPCASAAIASRRCLAHPSHGAPRLVRGAPRACTCRSWSRRGPLLWRRPPVLRPRPRATRSPSTRLPRQHPCRPHQRRRRCCASQRAHTIALRQQ